MPRSLQNALRSDASATEATEMPYETLPGSPCQNASKLLLLFFPNPANPSTSRPFGQGKRALVIPHQDSLNTADNRAHEVRGTSALRRPERSGDRTRSGGPRLCADRSEAETARGPGDLGFAPTEAKRRPHNVQWTLALDRPERSGDLEPQVPGRYAS